MDLGTYLKEAETQLPGLKFQSGGGEDLLKASDGTTRFRYHKAIVFKDGVLSLRAVTGRKAPSGTVTASVYVPITPELLDTLAPELGPIQFDVIRPNGSRSTQGVSVVINRQDIREQEISTAQRPIPRAVNPFDKLITGIVTLDVLDEDNPSADQAPSRVVATFATLPSLLNRRLFSPLGELGNVAATALLVVSTNLSAD